MGLKTQINALIENTPDDAALLAKLTALATEEWEFWRHVGTWGPVLYDRNRVLFLPLIERNLSPWNLRGTRKIQAWMELAEANGDVRLYRSLLQAYLQNKHDWSGATKGWTDLLLEKIRAAPDKQARKFVLDTHDLWYDLSDEVAVELYRLAPDLLQDFIVGRLERERWYDVIYEKLAEEVRAAGDEDFYFELYRRTFPPKRWEKDVARLCEEIADPVRLDAELERRHLSHPEGGVSAKGYWKIFEARGRDVSGYLARHLPNHEQWGSDGDFRKMIDHAAAQGWWDIWGLIGKYQQPYDSFSKLIEDAVKDGSVAEDILAARLMMLAGSRSGWGDWRFPTVLTESAALALYERFPDLLRGPFAQHLKVDQQISYAKVAKRAVERGDEAMVDLLFARGLEFAGHRWQRDDSFKKLTWYEKHAEGLRRDPEAFALRGMRVLQHLGPLGRFQRFRRQNNPLYPLFFGDVSVYRSVRDQARDLLESVNDEVRQLGARLITLERDALGRSLGARNTDHLLAFLLDESSRALRIASFDALALAAESSEVVARHIHERVTELFDLERRQYPRDRLVELVGRIIHFWPALRKPSEQPLVYRKESA